MIITCNNIHAIISFCHFNHAGENTKHLHSFSLWWNHPSITVTALLPVPWKASTVWCSTWCAWCPSLSRQHRLLHGGSFPYATVTLSKQSTLKDDAQVSQRSEFMFFWLSEKYIFHQVGCAAVNNVQFAVFWKEIRVKVMQKLFCF